MSIIGDTIDPEDPLAPPIEIDPANIAEEMFAKLRERNPGWTAFPTAWDTNLLQATAETAAVSREAFSAGVVRALTGLIGELHDIPQLDGKPATSTLTVTALDTLGHTEPAGMSVYIGDLVLVTTDDLVVEVGETTGQVPIEVVEVGAQPNGVTGAVEIDALDWLASVDPVVLDLPLAGGESAETLLEYQLRMIGELAVPRRAVRGEDFVFYAQRNPAVGAAWALPLFNADTSTPDVPLTDTLVVTDDAGLALDAGELTAIRDDLIPRTIENLDLFVISPDYLEIDVDAEIITLDGFDPGETAAAVEERIRDFLNPRKFADRRAEAEQTAPPAEIHRNDLVAVANYVFGVKHVNDLTIGDGSSDTIALPDGITLPTAGDVNVTEA